MLYFGYNFFNYSHNTSFHTLENFMFNIALNLVEMPKSRLRIIMTTTLIVLEIGQLDRMG